MTRLRTIVAATLAGFIATQALTYPVTVQSCDREVTFDAQPSRAMSNDTNITEMMLILGLEDRMVGYSGISETRKILPQLRDKLAKIPQISPDYATKEDILGADADFYFAGWNYGLRVNGEVTPESLDKFGIQVYELTESCIHLGPQPEISLEALYNDLSNLGKIFGVEDQARKIITGMKEELETFLSQLNVLDKPKRVFVYDSGESDPFTAGRYAMPNALIAAAGGRNIMDSVDRSWTTVSFEEVVAGNPDLIIVVNYGEVTAEQKREFILSHPALQDISAVKNESFLTLEYSEVTPGPQNIEAIKKIGMALWDN